MFNIIVYICLNFALENLDRGEGEQNDKIQEKDTI